MLSVGQYQYIDLAAFFLEKATEKLGASVSASVSLLALYSAWAFFQPGRFGLIVAWGEKERDTVGGTDLQCPL